jgi:hypothetical protein
MFKAYGLLGMLMVVFAQVSVLLRIEPFATWYIPIIWFGYIFVVDAMVYMLKRNSMLCNRLKKFALALFISLIFWLLFEFYNKYLGGWYYVGLPESRFQTILMSYMSFSTIVPAIFETWELVEQLHLFTKVRFKFKVLTNSYILNTLIVVGLIFVVTPFLVISPWAWVLVWTGFILLLDPILYLFHNEKSLIMEVKKKRFNTVISLFLAGYVCGFLWEFWNYWSHTKWYYTVPILENIKIFEIPAIGFLAYGPFALELYVMYQFVRFLFSKRFWSVII